MFKWILFVALLAMVNAETPCKPGQERTVVMFPENKGCMSVDGCFDAVSAAYNDILVTESFKDTEDRRNLRGSRRLECSFFCQYYPWHFSCVGQCDGNRRLGKELGEAIEAREGDEDIDAFEWAGGRNHNTHCWKTNDEWSANFKDLMKDATKGMPTSQIEYFVQMCQPGCDA